MSSSNPPPQVQPGPTAPTGSAAPISRWPAAWCVLGCLVAFLMLGARSFNCSLEVSMCVAPGRTQVYAGALRDRGGHLIRNQDAAFYFNGLPGPLYVSARTDSAGRYCFVWYSDGVPDVFPNARLRYDSLLPPDTRPPPGCRKAGPTLRWSKLQNAGSSWHVRIPAYVALAGLLTALAAVFDPTWLLVRTGYVLTAAALLGATFALGG